MGPSEQLRPGRPRQTSELRRVSGLAGDPPDAWGREWRKQARACVRRRLCAHTLQGRGPLSAREPVEVRLPRPREQGWEACLPVRTSVGARLPTGVTAGLCSVLTRRLDPCLDPRASPPSVCIPAAGLESVYSTTTAHVQFCATCPSARSCDRPPQIFLPLRGPATPRASPDHGFLLEKYQSHIIQKKESRRPLGPLFPLSQGFHSPPQWWWLQREVAVRHVHFSRLLAVLVRYPA